MMLDLPTVARTLGSAPRPRRHGRATVQPATIVIVEPADRIGRFRACLDGRVIVAASCQPFVDSARVLIAAWLAAVEDLPDVHAFYVGVGNIPSAFSIAAPHNESPAAGATQPRGRTSVDDVQYPESPRQTSRA